VHPAAGVVLFVISALTTHHHSAKAAPVFILPMVMAVLLAVQAGAIKVTRTKSGTAD
jgi:hypothetical protein